MMTASILIGALGALIAIIAWAIVRRPERQETWICTRCRQGFGSRASAQRHLTAAHQRPNQTRKGDAS